MAESPKTESFKNFNAIVAAKREAKGESPAFVLGPNDEKWHTLPEIPAHAVFEFASAEKAEATVEFLASMLVPEEKQAFLDIVNSEEFIVSIDTLQEIVGWLGEWYSGNPDEPSKS